MRKVTPSTVACSEAKPGAHRVVVGCCSRVVLQERRKEGESWNPVMGVAIAEFLNVDSYRSLLSCRSCKEAFRRTANLHDDAEGVAVDAHGGVGGLSVGRHFEVGVGSWELC